MVSWSGILTKLSRTSAFDGAVLFALRLRQKIVRIVWRLLYPKLRAGDSLKRVMVFRTGRLGDFLVAVPALHLLRSRLPDARIVLATTVSSLRSMQTKTKAYADLAALPWLDFVSPSVVDRAVAFEMSGKTRGLGSLRKLLGEEAPDAIFVLPYMGESLPSKLKKLLYFRMAGYRRPIYGFDGFASRLSMRRAQFRLGMYAHEVYGPVQALSECAPIGAIQEKELVQNIAIPDAAVQWAAETLKGFEEPANILIAVAPGASFAHKTWPVDRFLSVCRQLRERFGAQFVVLGADIDRPLGATLQQGLEAGCLDLTGRTSVTQLAAILSNCQLFVGNDSGPVHVASAVGCPCITVTSALDFPGLWEPWKNREGVVRTRLDCEYCLSLTCCPLNTNACIQSIGISEVLGRCLDVLHSVVPTDGHASKTAAEVQR